MFSEFKGYSQRFDNLSQSIKENLSTIIFCYREPDLSLTVVTKAKNVFVEMCKDFIVPSIILSEDAVKWGVDLESIDSEKIRIYIEFPKNKEISIYGFYISKDGKILEKKVYSKYMDNNQLIIDRYDSMGNVISKGEIEVECEESDWTGPSDLVKIAKDNNYKHAFIKKISKNQTYLVIHKKYIQI